MGDFCTVSPTNKKEYISDIAKILIKNNGKKKYYKPEEVKEAHKQSKWYDGLDFSCWGMSTFSSHTDFDNYHQETGEICDYVEMKTEMISGLSITSSVVWTDIPDIDVDASWLDFGEFFEGVGEFLGAIFDGV
tara:strand:- start:89 stop:487 length:399 start_codon:yes stop_codon:yes gene_type:complete